MPILRHAGSPMQETQQFAYSCLNTSLYTACSFSLVWHVSQDSKDWLRGIGRIRPQWEFGADTWWGGRTKPWKLLRGA